MSFLCHVRHGTAATLAACALGLAAWCLPVRAADDGHGPPTLPAATAAPATVAATGTPSEPSEPSRETHRMLVMLRALPVHARVDGGYGGGYGDAVQRRMQTRIAERIAQAHHLAVVTQWPMPTLGVDCVVMDLPDGVAVDDAIRDVQGHAEVAWAQPLNRFQAQGHADPLFKLQPTADLWHLDALHAVATGRRVRVALVDSGVDATHPDLVRQLEEQHNFVDGQPYRAELHGTAVAGLVAAQADNGLGMVGVAPDARLVSLRACWQDGAHTVCDSLSLAKALQHAIEHPVEIINMSLSGPVDPLIGRLIDIALAHRQQVVAAVDPVAADGGFPAQHPGVVAVADGATPARAGDPAGTWRAPARDLPTTVPGGQWRMMTGTSFAAAQVSGLLAVLAQSRARNGTGPTRLVRAPDGSIDTCASMAASASPSAVAADAPALAALAVACRGAVAPVAGWASAR